MSKRVSVTNLVEKVRCAGATGLSARDMSQEERAVALVMVDQGVLIQETEVMKGSRFGWIRYRLCKRNRQLRVRETRRVLC